MRWLFWVLVFANLVGFYWFSQLSDHRANKRANQSSIANSKQSSGETFEGENRLVLVKEVNASVTSVDSIVPSSSESQN